MKRRRFLALALASPFAGLIPKARAAHAVPRAVIENIPLVAQALGLTERQFRRIVMVAWNRTEPQSPEDQEDREFLTESRPC